MEYREIIPFPQQLDLKLRLPGSKSITSRALLCAGLARGKSRIHGALKSEDTAAMKAALKVLGVKINEKKDFIEVDGVGSSAQRVKKGRLVLNTGNSGIATRFLAALACFREGVTVIKTGEQMAKRPMSDLIDALKQLGAKIYYLKKKGHTPFEITPSFRFLGKVEVAGNRSSQYLSALLISAPLFPGLFKIRVIGKLVSRPYIDTTIAVMKSFGVRVQNKNYQEFLIRPQSYKACDYRVEGDATAGTYFSSINYLHGGSLAFENLGLKSIQGDVDYPKALARLGKGRIDMKAMPDAAMTLAVTAPFVKGKTAITGLETLRIKETDRLKALATELEKVGVKTKVTRDSIVIQGNRTQETGNRLFPVSCVLFPSKIKTYHDHRMAMSFSVIGTKIPGVVIGDPDCVNKTYPDFWKDLELAYLSPISLGKKNLVLTGMRCSGKNYLGRRIAKVLHRKFIDLDAEIERDQKMPISQIVKVHGWPFFRNVEQKICTRFRETKNLVIATGGGVVLDPLNMRALKKNGVVVFVFADPRALALRLRHTGNRPALHGKDPILELEEVWQERRSLYLHYADIVWDNTSGEVIEGNLEKIFS